jgi:uroporphyrinogen-III synthase
VRPVHVILTQPALRAGSLAQALEAGGHRVARWPLIDAGPEPGLDWTALFDDCSEADWVIFPSPAAVASVFAEAHRSGRDWPARTGIALVGPGSHEEVARWRARLPGLRAATIIEPAAEPFDAAALAAHPALADLSGRRVLVLRRRDGSRSWPALLGARGASVREVIAYRALPAAPPESAAGWLAARWREHATVVASIASADAGRRLAAWARRLDQAGDEPPGEAPGNAPGEAPGKAPGEPPGEWLLGRPVLTVHPRIAQALSQSGWRDVRVHAPGTEALLGRVESLRHQLP